MTLVIVCAVVVLVIAAAVIMRVRHERERSAIIDAAWQRMAASASRPTFVDWFNQKAAEEEQAALHRAIADKLIPRFAPPEERPL